ncbi:phosphoserine phosphatase SerB [Acidisphaera sp. L21]|jgi:phosphoserine phosphatase|uniref:phosphoserine phosphatase SerB n=1 Tax=Acidisphaera sp. L21 TaxID=1641851 RepID=UPI00131C25D1|nr:phosphoserine phosphatase SerB [Acidisphaera sp. L21]
MPHILTLVAARASTTLQPATIGRVRDVVSGGTPLVLSPGEAVDIPCPRQPDMHAVRAALGAEAVDAMVMQNRGRRKGLLIADMDSTIVTGETLDELAVIAGVGERVAEITKRSMNGEVDFADALRERVALLRGLDLAALEQTWTGVQLTPGAKTLVATMRAHNATTALVSGGFTFFTGRVAELCGFDIHRANTLEDDGTALTGVVGEPILDRDAKLATLEELATTRGLRLRSTLAVGDGANDMAMVMAAGMGVAYHAKPIVAATARHRVDHADLRALLFAQGYPASAFAEDA